MNEETKELIEEMKKVKTTSEQLQNELEPIDET